MNLRVRMSIFASALTLTASGLFALATPAFATGGVEVYNRGSGKCLTVQDGSTTAGAAIVQEPCLSSFGQHWRFAGSPGGIRQVVSIDTGLCTFASNLTNAAPILQEPCSFIDTSWTFTDLTPDGTARVLRMNVYNTNACLDLENGWTNDGVVLQVWSCNPNTNNQKWDVITAPH